MRAPALSLFIAFIFLFNLSFAQTAGKGMLNFPLQDYQLAVNKNNQLVVVTRGGDIAFADSISGIWHKSLVEAHIVGEPNRWFLIDNICYFNADTAFVSGGIGDDYNKMDLIYRTVDGGKSWKPVKFGMAGWVSDAVFLDNGEAWLSVDRKGIVYTNDYGLTWKPLTFPYNGLHYADIYFNNKREGIVEIDPKQLAYTTDKGKTWINIPSPLMQGKYKKTDFIRDSSIDRVAIFHDYVLVCQEDMVFYSRKNRINWAYMPGYRDFYTDPYNSALFFENSRGKFIKTDNKLKPVATFDGDFYKSICRNGNLFSFHFDKLSRINPANQLVASPAYTNDTSDIPVHDFGYTGHNTIGVYGNKIYYGEVRKNNWRYAFTLPFATDSGSLSMKGEDTIVFVNRGNDSVFYYSIKDGQVDKREKQQMFAGFSKAAIKKITISRGSSGDFYNNWNVARYENINGKFVRIKLDTAALNGNLLPKEIPDTLSCQTVTAFGKQIPELFQKKRSFEELGFTQADYDSCKKHILQFKAMIDSNKSAEELRECPFSLNCNNLDFSRLLSLVDSVGIRYPSVIDYYLHGFHGWSTDVDELNIEIINAEGQGLMIHYHYFDYFEKQPFYIAWRIDFNGLHSTSTAIEINRFLNAVFPHLLNDKGKVGFLQELVKEAYLRETQDK